MVTSVMAIKTTKARSFFMVFLLCVAALPDDGAAGCAWAVRAEAVARAGVAEKPCLSRDDHVDHPGDKSPEGEG
jgi:hypothetical protein